MITDRTVALRRLTLPGYRGPLLLAALLAVLAVRPDGALHSGVAVAGAIGGMIGSVLVMVPPMAVMFLPVALPFLLVGVLVVGATITKPFTWPHRPGTSALLGLALGCAAVIVGLSVPGEDYAFLGAGGFTLVGLPLAWLLWHQWPVARDGANPAGRWRWAVAPLLVAATVLTATQTDPTEARFALARPALTDWAEHALATGTADPDWVAGYLLTETELADGGAKFAIGGGGLFGDHGYVYFPPGTTPPASRYYHSLGDGWYSWDDSDHF
ncbi:hypothetical protein [Kitasatospora griseola]|uniref:hypothetical protein n=1 Tax=Kitasatospora griseola TaxID=2064 RepID=UPI00166FC062|nr:hypothetical protein [Kitasatospora griseola]GGQ76740.1 hypothetical protein GCM10010195_35600 [Kitasatospora griseola]